MKIRNGFYNFPEEDSLAVGEVLENLPRRVSNGMIDFPSLSRSIEKHKVATLVRLVTETMTRDPEMRVIVYVKFLSTMDSLFHKLQEFLPKMIVSKTDPKVLMPFRRSVGGFRLLIATIHSLSSRFDFSDIEGSKPLTIFLSTGVNIESLRLNFSDNTSINLVFDKGNKKEARITGRRYLPYPSFEEECESSV